MTQATADTSDHDFVISRTFNASRDLVFDAWSNPEHLKKWSVERCTNDPRPGGAMHYCMRTPDGTALWGKWIYRAITPPERLEYIQTFSDEAGGLTRHPFAPEWPLEMLSTVTFEETAGKTTMTIRWSPHDATDSERATFHAAQAGMQQGWAGMFDQLAAYLAKA
jgi:uncharacterized protein YndB with AHSA1/START domain